MTSKNLGSTIFGFTILGLAVGLLLLIPQQVKGILTKDIFGMIGFPPYVFPAISLVAIALLSIAWLVQIHWFQNAGTGTDEGSVSFDQAEIRKVIRAIITLCILVIGAFSLKIIGFIPCIALMTAGLLAFFGLASCKMIATLAITMSLFIYFFFQTFLKILFPEGFILPWLLEVF